MLKLWGQGPRRLLKRRRLLRGTVRCAEGGQK